MSIASEITRLQGVKSDILTAIADKGVTVPAGSALDDCPGLIETIGGFAGGNKNYVDYSSNYPWFYTPNFNIDNARVIEENIVCKANAYIQGSSYHICGGQWYSGTMSKFNGIAVYIWTDQIEFDYGDNVSANYDFITGISYDFSKWIRKNIVYDKNSGIATCKIYYDNELVCTYTKAISDLYFANDVPYSVGGARSSASDARNFSGIIDFNKSYIRIDGNLVWGVDNLKKDEAVIGGKTYRTVQMPDGKSRS